MRLSNRPAKQHTLLRTPSGDYYLGYDPQEKGIDRRIRAKARETLREMLEEPPTEGHLTLECYGQRFDVEVKIEYEE